jgi:hypothetical protein
MPTQTNPTHSSAEAEQDDVLTPGGPRPRSATHAVAVGEEVHGNPDGSSSVGPIQNRRQDGSLAVATDLVLTPGGYRPSSMVHHIESGAVIDGRDHNFTKVDHTGKLLAELGRIEPKTTGKPLMPFNVQAHNPALVPALGSGWITYAGWTESASPVSYFTTTWVVPPEPATQSGQTIFLFNGIQNQTMIYQPVLQWGPSAAGGGNYWSVGSWYADGQGGHSNYSTLVRVAVGQVLTGVMSETGSSAAGYSYNCVFSGLPTTSLNITNVQQLTWCIQTLEAYSCQKCSDYPATSRTGMTNIEIMAGGKVVTPTWAATTPVTDCGQHTVVVSNASPGGEVDLYYNNAGGITDKVTLGETSPSSPTLASLNGKLYVAWRGVGNNQLNVLCSADGGMTWGGKFVSAETTGQAPALCAHNGMLFVGWTGVGNNQLNVAHVSLSGNSVTGLANKVTLGDSSSLGPALASFNGNLYLAWKGNGNNSLNVEYSGNNGASFGGKFVSPETSPYAPTMAVVNGILFLGWTGVGNLQLNVARVSGNALVNKVVLGDSSAINPALSAFDANLYLGWKGNGNNNLNVEHSANSGGSFVGKLTSAETSALAPGLVAHNNGRLYVSWTGVGNSQLNIAQVNG